MSGFLSYVLGFKWLHILFIEIWWHTGCTGCTYTQGHSEGGGGVGKLAPESAAHSMSTIQRTDKQLSKSSVLTNTIHLQSQTHTFRFADCKFYSGPTFVLVSFMLHLPTEALNADWENCLLRPCIHVHYKSLLYMSKFTVLLYIHRANDFRFRKVQIPFSKS